jgi:hypothetical protein
VVSGRQCCRRHTARPIHPPRHATRPAALCALTARQDERTRAGKEGFFRHGKVTMVVHPAMVSDSADELCERSEAVIKETLHKYDYLVKQ